MSKGGESRHERHRAERQPWLFKTEGGSDARNHNSGRSPGQTERVESTNCSLARKSSSRRTSTRWRSWSASAPPACPGQVRDWVKAAFSAWHPTSTNRSKNSTSTWDEAPARCPHFLWLVEGSPNLSAAAQTALADPAHELYLSAASVVGTGDQDRQQKARPRRPVGYVCRQMDRDLSNRDVAE